MLNRVNRRVNAINPAALVSTTWLHKGGNVSCQPLLWYTVDVFADVSAPAADDRNSAGRFPADSSTEDLQVSSAAARTAVLHVAVTSGLQAADRSRWRDEGHYVTGQRTQAEDGEHWEVGRMAEHSGPLAG